MQVPAIPRNEHARLEALRALHALDTPPEAELDDLTQLAAEICGTPIALLSLVDENRQWFKSNVGLGVPETERDIAFCAHAILQQDVLEVKDAVQDPRFADNVLVKGAPFLRFYAGAPLETADGYNIGTLCVLDTVPRTLSTVQLSCLRLLARSAMRNLELRHTGKGLGKELLQQQSATESKAWLSAYLAHESRNMLTVLGGMLDLLSMSALTAEQGSYLAAARSSADHLHRLMQDVLDLTRSDARTLSLTELPFELAPCLQALAEQYDLTVRPRGVTVRIDLEPSLPKLITGDVKRLEQVLHNLLGNAAKFTREGEVVLSVRQESLTDGLDVGQSRHTLRFEVRDHGVGMDAATLATLFEPYRPGASNEKGGTGLGLYIARQIVEQMGGTIGANSRVGEGSTFHVVLSFPRV